MDDSVSGLSFEERGIANALAQHVLSVPLNQRSYAWSEDEVQTLLDDLYRAFAASESIYFLGTVVLTKGPHGQLQIADGQQRLATTSIVLATIRDYLLELGDEAGANKYQSTYLLDYDVRKKQFAPKLHLNFEDNDYFRDTILKPPKERAPYSGPSFDSHERLRLAAERARTHVRTIVAGYRDVEKASRLYDWVDFLHDAAKVILISVPGTVGNAFKMFETLNARGAPATQTDIVKNYLFDKAKDRIGDIHPKWVSMLSTIETLGEEDLLLTFIRHAWIAEHGPTIERELGDRIEAAVRGERQAVDLVNSLNSAAVDYVALLMPREHPRWSALGRDARESIHTITRELGSEQIRPLLLAITRHFPTREAEKTFELLLSWTVRFLIVGVGGGGLLDRNYGLRALAISKAEIRSAKKLAESMSELIPNDEVFKRAFSVATVRRSNLARYYLRALELHLKEERKPQLVPSEDTTAVNLEHVLPVTPSKEWSVNPDIAAAYYRRLGNMVLLNAKENVEIGNQAFSEKKVILKRSPFFLTADVAKSREWGPKQIDTRQQRLAEYAAKVWPI